MNPRSILTISPSVLLRTGLLAVIALTGCAPASTPDPFDVVELPQPTQTQVEPTPTAAQPLVVPTDIPPTQEQVEVPQPIATSRGPNLEATDPANVSLASGNLQLVEFFRFT